MICVDDIELEMSETVKILKDAARRLRMGTNGRRKSDMEIDEDETKVLPRININPGHGHTAPDCATK